MAQRVMTHRLAQGLGWFSIALGVVELFGSRRLTGTLGTPRATGLARGYGTREIATGMGILMSDRPTPWVWGRVLGDALDLATLAAGLGTEGSKRTPLIGSLVAVAGVTAVDLYCARQLQAEDRAHEPPAFDYSDRSGWTRPVEEMRGVAADVTAPRDLGTPPAMRPQMH